MIINDKLNTAIVAYCNDNGGAMRLMERLGVSKATAIKIGKGRSQKMHNDIWARLEPLIAPYLATQATPAAPATPAATAATAATPATTAAEATPQPPMIALINKELLRLTEEQQKEVYRYIVKMF